MKLLYIFLPVSILVSIPIILDLFILTDRHYPVVWSLLLIPHVMITVSYPRWKIIIVTAFAFSTLKYSVVLLFGGFELNAETLNLIHLGTFINWSVFLTIAYFRMKYHQTLEQVKMLTIIDALTGLYNRRYFHLYMEKVIPFSQRTGNPLVLILLDIDHFKKVNDNYGHQCGDEAIKHISKIINNTIRTTDTFVRFGGEEFAILLPTTNLIDSQLLAERIRQTVSDSPFIYWNKTINLTISMGIAMYGGEKEAEFIENADKSLYQAKDNGRNQVAIFNEKS